MYIFTDDVFTRAMRFIIPEPPDDVDREKEKIRQEKTNITCTIRS